MRNKRQKIDDELSQKIIQKYIEEDRKKSREVKKQVEDNEKVNNKTQLKVYKDIRKRLVEVTNNPYYICDVLIKYLFVETNSKFKDTLWRCFGKEIVRNLEYNILGVKRCLCCGAEIEVINKKKYCNECAKKIKNEQNKKYYSLGK